MLIAFQTPRTLKASLIIFHNKCLQKILQECPIHESTLPVTVRFKKRVCNVVVCDTTHKCLSAFPSPFNFLLCCFQKGGTLAIVYNSDFFSFHKVVALPSSFLPSHIKCDLSCPRPQLHINNNDAKLLSWLLNDSDTIEGNKLLYHATTGPSSSLPFK